MGLTLPLTPTSPHNPNPNPVPLACAGTSTFSGPGVGPPHPVVPCLLLRFRVGGVPPMPTRLLGCTRSRYGGYVKTNALGTYDHLSPRIQTKSEKNGVLTLPLTLASPHNPKTPTPIPGVSGCAGTSTFSGLGPSESCPHCLSRACHQYSTRAHTRCATTPLHRLVSRACSWCRAEYLRAWS